MTDTPIVSIKNLSKRFGKVAALDNVSLDIHAGEIFALLGPSGCGKSTLLRILSGFETPSEGELLLDNKDLIRLKPNKRPINMVFQSYAVFPHMSVEENVAYGLKMDGVAKAEIKRRVGEALEQVHLEDFNKRKPHQLSGGQRQRVALARVLVKKPRLLLLDEPLSALDAKLRDAMRLELVKLQQSVGITFVIVTHDQAEAMAIADRIAVLNEGRLRQVASPADLYQNPVDAFVADFVGKIHCFNVSVAQVSNESISLEADGLNPIALPATAANQATIASAGDMSDMLVAVRPEHVQISLSEPLQEGPALLGQLGDIAFQGQYSIVEIIIHARESLTAVVHNSDAQQLHAAGQGAPIWAYWNTADMLLLPKSALSGPNQ